jgi:hypothetical protein
MCKLDADAKSRGYPQRATVNYMCYDLQCPRRENIMQMYNGYLKINPGKKYNFQNIVTCST